MGYNSAKIKMEKLVFCLFSLCLLLGGCKTTNHAPNVVQAPDGNDRKRIEMPCSGVASDDENFFRDLGIGVNVNMQSARSAAVRAAKSMILDRLGGLAKGVSTDYARDVAGQSSSDKIQRLVEREFTNVIDKMLDDAGKLCDELYQRKSGEYEAYYAIEISKKEMIKKVSDALSENEELEIEFHRDQFRKYAEEYMDKMNKSKENNTRVSE